MSKVFEVMAQDEFVSFPLCNRIMTYLVEHMKVLKQMKERILQYSSNTVNRFVFNFRAKHKLFTKPTQYCENC